MAVTCKLLRQGDLQVDGGGYQIVEVYLVEGYSLGLNKAAILSVAQAPPSGEDVVPTLGSSYGSPSVLCQRLQVRRIAAQRAFIIVTYSDSVVSFGGAINDGRSAGAFGRMVAIDLPVFRARTDISGQTNYFYDPKTIHVPVASRWYDGTIGAIQSQEATIDQVWTALEGNIGSVHSTLGMRLVDYDQIIRTGSVRRLRLRFEAVSALPAYASGFFGDNSPPIPALPRDGEYVFSKYLPPDTSPTITIKTQSQRFRSWSTLPFTLTVSGPYSLQIT